MHTCVSYQWHILFSKMVLLFKDDIDHVKYNPYTLWVDKVSYKYMEHCPIKYFYCIDVGIMMANFDCF
jgi:hypothetical protein